MRASELTTRLSEATTRVRLLGVVGLDAAWEEILPTWQERAQGSTEFRADILCESDTMLFGKAFTTDTPAATPRRTFQNLKFVRDRALEVPALLSAAAAGAVEPKVIVETMHLWLPMSVAEIDGTLFASLWLESPPEAFEEIGPKHAWHDSIRAYVEAYFDPAVGRKYAASSGTEILELYDHGRIPRGIYPRSSFYDTDYSQLVVWALIFDRAGRLLIHRRSDNASDNRGMWDKSVGGHVDFSQDTDTARSVIREVVEELYKDEKSKGAATKHWAVSGDNMIHLGDWRPAQRRRQPFLEITALKQEWAFFRLPNDQRLYSPRELPGGGTSRLRVIADVYVFVAAPDLNDEALGELLNSKFKLVSLADLKNAMDASVAGTLVSTFEEGNSVPRFTPDLTQIMTGELRDSLEEIAQHIQRYVR